MGELADRLDRLAVEAWSPDGNIRVEARGKYQVDVRFRPYTYLSYTESALGHQLSRYRREYTEIMDAFLEAPIHDEDRDDRRFRERLEQMTVTGTSASGRLSVRSRALVRWELAIAAGTLRILTEQEFLADLDSAVADVLADYQAQLILLTDEIYDIGIPRSHRQPAAGNGRAG